MGNQIFVAVFGGREPLAGSADYVETLTLGRALAQRHRAKYTHALRPMLRGDAQNVLALFF